MYDTNYTRLYMALSCDQAVLADSMLARLHASAMSSVSRLPTATVIAAIGGCCKREHCDHLWRSLALCCLWWASLAGRLRSLLNWCWRSGLLHADRLPQYPVAPLGYKAAHASLCHCSDASKFGRLDQPDAVSTVQHMQVRITAVMRQTLEG